MMKKINNLITCQPQTANFCSKTCHIPLQSCILRIGPGLICLFEQNTMNIRLNPETHTFNSYILSRPYKKFIQSQQQTKCSQHQTSSKNIKSNLSAIFQEILFKCKERVVLLIELLIDFLRMPDSYIPQHLISLCIEQQNNRKQVIWLQTMSQTKTRSIGRFTNILNNEFQTMIQEQITEKETEMEDRKLVISIYRKILNALITQISNSPNQCIISDLTRAKSILKSLIYVQDAHGTPKFTKKSYNLMEATNIVNPSHHKNSYLQNQKSEDNQGSIYLTQQKTTNNTKRNYKLSLTHKNLNKRPKQNSKSARRRSSQSKRNMALHQSQFQYRLSLERQKKVLYQLKNMENQPYSKIVPYLSLNCRKEKTGQILKIKEKISQMINPVQSSKNIQNQPKENQTVSSGQNFNKQPQLQNVESIVSKLGQKIDREINFIGQNIPVIRKILVKKGYKSQLALYLLYKKFLYLRTGLVTILSNGQIPVQFCPNITHQQWQLVKSSLQFQSLQRDLSNENKEIFEKVESLSSKIKNKSNIPQQFNHNFLQMIIEDPDVYEQFVAVMLRTNLQIIVRVITQNQQKLDKQTENMIENYGKVLILAISDDILENESVDQSTREQLRNIGEKRGNKAEKGHHKLVQLLKKVSGILTKHKKM